MMMYVCMYFPEAKLVVGGAEDRDLSPPRTPSSSRAARAAVAGRVETTEGWRGDGETMIIMCSKQEVDQNNPILPNSC